MGANATRTPALVMCLTGDAAAALRGCVGSVGEARCSPCVVVVADECGIRVCVHVEFRVYPLSPLLHDC